MRGDWGAQASRLLVSASRRNDLLPAIAFIVSVSIAISAAAQDIDKKTEQIRYAAIGDSYSIGEGTTPDKSWPAVLTKHLKEKGFKIELVANPSRTGWTTQQAIDLELPIFREAKPNFATLQIGVNDWVQGVDEETFRKQFVTLVDKMLELLPNKNRLLIVTIPDFSVAPAGSKYARGRKISEGLSRFNQIIAEETKRRGLRGVDVFELSKKMRDDPSLVAKDGLHPSAKEYAEWEKVIFPAALELLRREIRDSESKQ